MYMFYWCNIFFELSIFAQDPKLSQAVFKVFDTDTSGTMDFSEYMQAKQALKLNKANEEILETCMKDVKDTLDVDGDGSITKEEFVRKARRRWRIRQVTSSW
jgi:Ca2+-binding EF-hand superfamily protein